MIYNNPKSGNKNLSKLEILTPDTSKEEIITAFSTLGTVSSDTLKLFLVLLYLLL